MTVRALAGLLAFNALLLLSGAAVLWLARGWRTWLDLARLGGVAYLVGVATCGSVWSLLLVAGVPFSGWLVLVTPLVLLSAAAAAGRRLGRTVPRLGVGSAGLPLVTAFGIAAAAVLLQGLFRGSRLAGLYHWDAWVFWVPKAKAIYYFDGLDEYFFTALPGAAYPPLVPTVDAAAFHFIGAPDVITLHTQFWFLGAGFVWAFAGLLARRVPPWILWPFVVLLLVAPRLGPRFSVPEADLLLDYFFVLGALLLALWLLDRRRWQLVLATVTLSALVLTKREGILLAGVLAAATLLAGAREWRKVLPSLGAAAAVVVAVGLPWRLWYVEHGVPGEGPSSADPTANAERAWPALRLALDVLFDSGFWSVITPVVIGALAVAALARLGRLVTFFGSALVLVTLGGGWITWAIPELPITTEAGGNPIVRYMGAAALLAVAASPLLLGEAWVVAQRGRPRRAGEEKRVSVRFGPRARRRLAVAIVAIPVLAYPVVAMAAGLPRFPSRDDCVRPPVAGRSVDVVYGRFGSPVEAEVLLERVLEVGLTGTEVLPDDCGRWRVVLVGVPSIEIAQQVAAQAETVDLDPRLELGSE